MKSPLFSMRYKTKEGFDDLVMTSDGEVLTGLSFVESRKLEGSGTSCGHAMLPVFQECRRWLDLYFSGREPGFLPPYALCGASEFRLEVSRLMLEIPFGQTVTYGELAKAVACRRGLPKMSAQAIGGAVGWNPLCLIIPCHRVIGAQGKMTGYGGGLHNKLALLAHEQRHSASSFPRR